LPLRSPVDVRALATRDSRRRAAQAHVATNPLSEDNMTDLAIRTLEGSTKTIGPDIVSALRGRVRGTVALPGEDGYDAARTIWNAMIDRRPGLVVRCLGAADVIAAVTLARDEKLLLAVRGGGHNIAGNAVCDGGLLIDLSLMRSVRVDPEARTARVEPGATLADFDKEAQQFGLATPLGINSTTGVAGLTLGGGFGWTTRKLGMSVDNLISADVVTADGKLVRASATENPDLFWALRGGGGNFGIVTSFEFKLHPLGPEVLSGLIVHPLAMAGELLPQYRRIAREAPDELTVWVVMRKAPPLPFLPAEWHGKEVLVFAACYAGDMKEGEKALKALRSLGKPIADVIAPHPFTAWQAAFDPLLTPGARNYWKSHDFADLPDAAINTILRSVRELPSPECEVFIAHVGGAMARIPANATPFPNRDAHFVMNVHTRWQDKAQDQECIAWARHLFGATAPFASDSVYVNFMPDDENDRVEKAYGTNYRRLAEVKRRYDPANLFRMNQNIRPAR
jgi:FAD/FMN-containing dehydrogenase